MKHYDSILLFSGGIDSTVILAQLKAAELRVLALTFSYGQRHKLAEENAQAKILDHYNMLGDTFHISLPEIHLPGVSLTNTHTQLEEGRAVDEIAADDNLPSTFVPGRNALMLTYGMVMARSFGAKDIYIGANRDDFQGFPDCRPGNIYGMELALNRMLGVEGVKIRIPLGSMSKRAIIKEGMSFDAPLHHAHTCYNPGKNHEACGVCDACVVRRNAFKEAGIEDPADYPEFS